jgi:predicted secreted Zn-dependent protease
MGLSMSRLPICALALLLSALVACGSASDDEGPGPGAGGNASGGSAGSGAAAGHGGTGAGVGGATAGTSADGGTASGNGGAGAGSAGRASGGTSGAGESGGAAGRGGSAGLGGAAGSSALGGGGGNGGQGASAGSSSGAGAGGEGNGPSSCVNPIETVDLSRLDASEAFEPYVVTGNSANQIRQSINQNRGMDYDAYTGWELRWSFGDCAGNGLVVTVDVTYVYPEWEPSANASPELTESWDTYMDALFCHEYGHAKHGLDCANEVFTALSAIDAGGDCNAQQAEADAAFDDILADCNERDVEYDEETDHGATMGAVFPP